MAVLELIRGRAIVDEGPTYYVFQPDAESTAGFYTIEPKNAIPRTTWASIVIRHLDKFKEHFQPEVQQTEAVLPAIVQPGYFYSFMYQGGEVKANSQIGKIEVSMNHPNLKRVATLLTKLSLQNSGTIYVI